MNEFCSILAGFSDFIALNGKVQFFLILPGYEAPCRKFKHRNKYCYNIKHEKQDQQGKAPLNEGNPYTFQ
jgi:hypothetical protein